MTGKVVIESDPFIYAFYLLCLDALKSYRFSDVTKYFLTVEANGRKGTFDLGVLKANQAVFVLVPDMSNETFNVSLFLKKKW